MSDHQQTGAGRILELVRQGQEFRLRPDCLRAGSAVPGIIHHRPDLPVAGGALDRQAVVRARRLAQRTVETGRCRNLQHAFIFPLACPEHKDLHVLDGFLVRRRLVGDLGPGRVETRRQEAFSRTRRTAAPGRVVLVTGGQGKQGRQKKEVSHRSAVYMVSV